MSIRDEVGHEVRYVARVETASYVATLGPQDSVALESGCGSFLWAERIQRRGARCIVIDPYRFRIIRDSWHKTDRHDAGALSLALWTSAQSGVELPRFRGHPKLHLRLGFGRVSGYHLPSENATTALYA